MDLMNTRFKTIYFQLSGIRRRPFFKTYIWLSISSLKIAYTISFIFMIFFLIKLQYKLSFYFFILWIFVIILDRIISVQRSGIVKLDIQNILKSIEKKDESISYKINSNLLDSLKDYTLYDLNSEDFEIKNSMENLVVYIKNFVQYKDLKNEQNLKQMKKFFNELHSIFDSHKFSQITHLIAEDYKHMRQQHDFDNRVHEIRSQIKSFVTYENVYETLAQFKKKGIGALEKLWLKFIELLNVLQTYRVGVGVFMGIVFFILFMLGKIQITSIPILKSLF